MSRQKKYQVTFRRTEELVVEVDAENEAEARAEAFDLVLGKSPMATVRAAPRVSMPQIVDRSATEWNVEKVVEIVMR